MTKSGEADCDVPVIGLKDQARSKAGRVRGVEN